MKYISCNRSADVAVYQYYMSIHTIYNHEYTQTHTNSLTHRYCMYVCVCLCVCACVCVRNILYTVYTLYFRVGVYYLAQTQRSPWFPVRRAPHTHTALCASRSRCSAGARWRSPGHQPPVPPVPGWSRGASATSPQSSRSTPRSGRS